MPDTPATDNAITTYLQRVWDFTPTHAHDAHQRLLQAPQALPVLERMMGGEEPEPDFAIIGGVTYADLLDKHRLAPIGAVLWWAWVERNPVAAHEGLRRGFDKPVFRIRSNKGAVQ